MGSRVRTEIDEDTVDGQHEAARLERGASVGRYIVVDRLGAGGMGVVYGAYDPELDRRVAIKVLHKAVSGSGSPSRGEQRLLREARALAQLNHRNVVAVHDVGTVGGRVFVAMEYVEGTTITKWLTLQTRSYKEILDVFLDAGRGLAAAHQSGIVHRDFKPDNVMVDEDGRVVVMDFGLARPEQTAQIRDRDELSPVDETTDQVSLTRTGAMLGTPAYMAPEQYEAGAIDARADQFSFCVALYEALYGERPFDGGTPSELLVAITDTRPDPRPPRGSTPRWLYAPLLRGLAPVSDDRFESMPDLLRVLDPRRRRTPLRWTVGVGVVVGGVAVTALALTWDAGTVSCAGAQRHLAGVWDDAERQRLETVFADSKLPYASSSVAAVATELDEYTGDWVRMRTEACEATHRLGDQSQQVLEQRLMCLDGRLRYVRAQVELFGQGKPSVIERAPLAVQGLPAVSSCGDLDFLRTQPLAADDPDHRARVEALETREAEVHAVYVAGEDARAIELGGVVADDAEALGRLDIRASTLLYVAGALGETGKLTEAAKVASQAAFAADLSGQDDLRGHILTELGYIVGFQQSRPEQGRWYLDAAAAAIARAGNAPRRRRLLLTYEGTLLSAQGRNDEAITALHAALDIDVEDEQHDTTHATILNNLASAHFQRGDFGEALALYQDIHLSSAQRLGEEHPLTATALANIGATLQSMGRRSEARDLLQRSVEQLEATVGPRAPITITSLNNLAAVLQDSGEYEAAARMFEEVVERAQADDAGSPVVAVALYNMSQLAIQTGDARRGLEYGDRAIDHVRGTYGDGHPYHAIALSTRGEALVELDRSKEAVTDLEAALEILSTAQMDPLVLAETRLNLARALRDVAGPRERITQLAEQAKPVFVERGVTTKRRLDQMQALLDTL